MPTEVPFRQIEISSPEPLRQFDAPACFVFASLKELLNAYGVSRVGTRIDFERYLVLTAHRGLCRTGGYGIAVSAIERSALQLPGLEQPSGERPGSEVNVRLNLRDPEPGAMAIMILTYPSVHVLIPREAVVSTPSVIPADTPVANSGEAPSRRVAFNFSDESGRIQRRVVRELG